MMWTETRQPLDDTHLETARQERYWTSLDQDPPLNSQAVEVDRSDNWIWVRLMNAIDADYEAYHTRHSIGFSWDKYCSVGQIYSLRSLDGVPQLTVLIEDGFVVHARGLCNDLPQLDQYQELERFARQRNWAIAPISEL